MNVIIKSKEEYSNQFKKKESDFIEDKNWNVPAFITFDSKEKMPVQKCIIEPFYNSNLNNLEKDFINFLESKDSVKWWFRNGDNGEQFLGIPYTHSSVKKLFYVDFIVQLNKGGIALFDTKGNQFDDTEHKSIGLKEYQKRNKGIFEYSGIVSNTTGVWKVYRGNGNPNTDKQGWEMLDI